MAPYQIINLGNLDPDYRTDEYTICTEIDDVTRFFAGYDFMGSVNWSDTWSHEHVHTLDQAYQIVRDLEAADAPAAPPAPEERTCAGYKIITAVRLTPCQEVVIGQRDAAPSRYVCWYCINGTDYHTGRYVETYRYALEVLADRIRTMLDCVPLGI